MTHFLEIRLFENSKKISSETGSLNRIFCFFTKTIIKPLICTSLKDLCVLKPFSLRRRGLTYDVHYTLKYLKMGILDMGNVCEEFTDAKDLIEKQLVHQTSL